MDPLVERLKVEFSDRQSQNAGYSLRAFARDLTVNITSLSMVLAEKRKPSKEMRATIVDRLLLSPYFALENHEMLSPIDGLEEDDHFRLIADWYHLAILNLVRPGAGPRSLADIAERLELSQPVVSTALARLKRLEFVEEREGNFLRTVKCIRTSEDVSSSALKHLHRDGLELAKQALLSSPIEERECSTTFLMMNPSNIAKAKDLLRKFRSEFISVFDPGLKASGKARLYMFSSNFFPLDRGTVNKRR